MIVKRIFGISFTLKNAPKGFLRRRSQHRFKIILIVGVTRGRDLAGILPVLRQYNLPGLSEHKHRLASVLIIVRWRNFERLQIKFLRKSLEVAPELQADLANLAVQRSSGKVLLVEPALNIFRVGVV